MLCQMQRNTTRGDNILDLVFTTIPDQIKNIDIAPGMADHDAVSVELDMTVKYTRKKPRKVYRNDPSRGAKCFCMPIYCHLYESCG